MAKLCTEEEGNGYFHPNNPVVVKVGDVTVLGIREQIKYLSYKYDRFKVQFWPNKQVDEHLDWYFEYVRPITTCLVKMLTKKVSKEQISAKKKEFVDWIC